MDKLKRAVIKEELVALTGDHLSAIILQQFLYWSERVSDFDLFIEEERARDPDLAIELRCGWIYKSASEMREEIMVRISEETVRRRISDLADSGWLDTRRNPDHAWDRTLQYRVNIHKIQTDLHKLGYVLDGYPLQIVGCIPHGVDSSPHGVESSPHGVEALSEITTETITESREDGGAVVWNGEVLDALRNFGVNNAEKLLEMAEPDVILAWLFYAQDHDLGPGFVVQQVKDGKEPPVTKTSEEKEEKEREERYKRYTGGKYAHLVQH